MGIPRAAYVASRMDNLRGMTENPHNNSSYGLHPDAPQHPNVPQYGAPQPTLTPEMLKDQKGAKQSGLLGTIFGALSLLILGFLSVPSLIVSIMGLRLSNKLAAAGVSPNFRGLNIAAIIVSSIAVALWLLGLYLRIALS